MVDSYLYGTGLSFVILLTSQVDNVLIWQRFSPILPQKKVTYDLFFNKPTKVYQYVETIFYVCSKLS